MIQIGHNYIPTSKSGFDAQAVLVLGQFDQIPAADMPHIYGAGVIHPDC